MTMSSVVGKKFIPYIASPPEALATSSSLDAYDLDFLGCLAKGEERGIYSLLTRGPGTRAICYWAHTEEKKCCFGGTRASPRLNAGAVNLPQSKRAAVERQALLCQRLLECQG